MYFILTINIKYKHIITLAYNHVHIQGTFENNHN